MSTVLQLHPREIVATMPGGVVSQVNLHWLISAIRRDGGIKTGERISHFEFDARTGLIRYRVERVTRDTHEKGEANG